MISIDPIAVGIHIVSFLILVGVLNLILYRPIRKILLHRKEKINGLGREIDTCLRDAEEKSLSHEQGLREAMTRGLKEKEVFLKAAAEEEKSIIEQITMKNQERLAEVTATISKDMEGVKATLLGEVDAFAEIISRKILGRTVS